MLGSISELNQLLAGKIWLQWGKGNALFPAGHIWEPKGGAGPASAVSMAPLAPSPAPGWNLAQSRFACLPSLPMAGSAGEGSGCGVWLQEQLGLCQGSELGSALPLGLHPKGHIPQETAWIGEGD